MRDIFITNSFQEKNHGVVSSKSCDFERLILPRPATQESFDGGLCSRRHRPELEGLHGLPLKNESRSRNSAQGGSARFSQQTLTKSALSLSQNWLLFEAIRIFYEAATLNAHRWQVSVCYTKPKGPGVLFESLLPKVSSL
jgi:hypothetical protein